MSAPFTVVMLHTIYVQTTGMPERGNPPPSSEIFIVISYHHSLSTLCKRHTHEPILPLFHVQ